jgi:hypothetical protein
MRKKYIAMAVTGVLAAPLAAQAGAVVKIGDDSKLELGMRLQTQYIATEKDRNGDGVYEKQTDFSIRRARLRFRADVTKWATMFIQSDFEEQNGTSPDSRILDAYIQLKPSELANLYVGQNMVPAIRQEVSGSAAHLALDRPGLAYKSLTWGGRSKFVFTNETYGDSNSKLVGRVGVRDLGATLFGSTSFNETVHAKYYLGVYDGVQTAGADKPRYTARAQVNFFDPEGGYYNSATYGGKKKTVGVGASYDSQERVALDQAAGTAVNYRLYSLDAFTEMPAGPGAVTAEAGYVSLNLGGGGTMVKADGTALGNAARAQGTGWFVQTGYFVNNWQPWFNYEKWNSDAADGRGSYKAYRVGVSYYFKGNNVNVKAGYEVFRPDTGFTSAQSDVKSAVASLNLDF